MKMKTALSIVFLTIIFFSCQREIDPGPTKNCKLVRLVQGTHNGLPHDTVYLFKYDASGKMIEILDSVNNYTTKIEYDSKGKIVKQIGQVAMPVSYVYDSQDRLVQITSFDSARFRLNYSTGKKPVSVTYYSGSSVDTTGATTLFDYSNGDIVKHTPVSGWATGRVEHYEYYDSLPNKQPNLDMILFFNGMSSTFNEWFLQFNDHLIKKSIYSDREFITRYSFENGNITSQVTNHYDLITRDTFMTLSRFYYYDCK